MPYYEMSLESGHEWIIQNDFTHVQLPLGTWLPIFLDTDWELYLKQTEELSTSHPSSDRVYSQQVAHWYHNLKQQLSPFHPLLMELVERQIPNRLCCQFYPENPSHLVSPEEISYLDALQNEQADIPTIQPIFLHGWLKDLLLLFAQLHQTQQQLEQLLDAVMGDVLEKKQHTWRIISLAFNGLKPYLRPVFYCLLLPFRHKEKRHSNLLCRFFGVVSGIISRTSGSRWQLDPAGSWSRRLCRPWWTGARRCC